MTGVFRKILPYLRPYLATFVFCLVLVLAVTAIELVKPWPLQIVVDNVLGGKGLTVPLLADLAPVALLAVACAGVVLVQALVGLGHRMVTDLRDDLYGHLQRLSLVFHSRQRMGDLMYRITADTFAVQTLMLNGVLPVLQAIAMLAGMFVIMWGMDATLTLVSLVVVPALWLTILALDRPIVDAATEMKTTESQVYSLVQWAIGAIRVVQAFGKEEEERRRLLTATRASMRANLRLYNWQTAYSAIVNTVIALGTALVLYAGAEAVIGGRLTLGQLLVFISYLATLYGPINTMSQTWAQIQGARIGAKRVFEILDIAPDLKDGPRPWPAKVEGRIAWKGVAFSYSPEVSVLKRIDLDAAPGEKIAVVGPTGAGKSTMLSLLPRFFDPTAGRVELDGVDIREYPIRELRRRVALVLQPPMIFPLSIRDNIAYGRPEASQSEIEEAARLARIDGLVASQPKGWDTQVGEGGVALSEGEKQRMTIARAMLMDAPVLILDEPTSALDAQTEAEVMAGLAQLTRGRTVFTIAHRLSTILKADRIVVLKDGVIVEAGSFAELLARDGEFAKLYRTQFQDAAPAA
jgi:ATP-binding cassette, subfamily B, bacterial